MQRYEPSDRCLGTGCIVFGVISDCLLNLPIRLVRRVVVEHIQDEAFLNRLAHGVEMERHIPVPVNGCLLAAEQFEGLGLRGRREGEERDVWLATATSN